MNIGETLKEIRNKKGLSQKVLAKLSGISQTYLSQIEMGDRKPTLEILKKICKALEIPFPVLAFITMEHGDIPENKLEAFQKIESTISILIKEFLQSEVKIPK